MISIDFKSRLLLHEIFVDLNMKRGIAFLGRRTRRGIGGFELPANVGGAIRSLGSQRRRREEHGNVTVEAHGILRRVTSSAALAGFELRVEGFAEEDLVTGRSASSTTSSMAFT